MATRKTATTKKTTKKTAKVETLFPVHENGWFVPLNICINSGVPVNGHTGSKKRAKDVAKAFQRDAAHKIIAILRDNGYTIADAEPYIFCGEAYEADKQGTQKFVDDEVTLESLAAEPPKDAKPEPIDFTTLKISEIKQLLQVAEIEVPAKPKPTKAKLLELVEENRKSVEAAANAAA